MATTRTSKYWTALEEVSAANMNKVAGGYLSQHRMTSPHTGIGTGETTITDLSATVTVNTSRLVLVIAYLDGYTDSGWADIRYRLKQDGATIATSVVYAYSTNVGYTTCIAVPLALSGITTTFTVTAQRYNGTGTVTINGGGTDTPSTLTIIDLGSQ